MSRNMTSSLIWTLMFVSLGLSISTGSTITAGKTSLKSTETMTKRTCAEERHVVVFDAGSSGTRVHVFSFLPPEDGDRVPTLSDTNDQPRTKKVKPGLSEIARSATVEDDVKNYLAPLLNYATNFVVPDQRGLTPVIFQATAGMRVIDDVVCDRVMTAVRDVLRSSGFLFEDSFAFISEGKREAALSWIAANYLSKRLADGSETIGLIEMGGASTQVVFEVEKTTLESLSADKVFVFEDSRGRRYNLYAASYLGYGQDYAMDTYFEHARSDEEPCCVRGGQCGPERDRRGIGAYETCVERVRAVLFQSERFTVPPSTMQTFVATENFYYTRSDVADIMPASFVMDMNRADDFGKELCAGSDAVLAVDRDRKLCFSVAFQTAFLDALGMFDGDTGAPKVTGRIRGVSVNWALGAAMLHLSQHKKS